MAKHQFVWDGGGLEVKGGTDALGRFAKAVSDGDEVSGDGLSFRFHRHDRDPLPRGWKAIEFHPLHHGRHRARDRLVELLGLDPDVDFDDCLDAIQKLVADRTAKV